MTEETITHSCACKFAYDECIDVCCYHNDLEDDYKKLQVEYDDLAKTFAEVHNMSLGYTSSQPKYKRVDLDEMKIKNAEWISHRQYNCAIDDIKAKYGDLYVVIEK